MRNPLKSQEAFAGHPSFTTNRSRHSLRWSTAKLAASTLVLPLFLALISGLWIWLSQFSTIGLGFASSAHKAEQYQLAAAVAPAVETAPVPHSKDAADDPVIWIHPSDPAKSAVMGNDKLGAYEVYNITTGAKLQSLPLDVANTDIRYNFPLGGERIALIAGYSATKNGLIAFKVAVDPATGDPHLVDVTAPGAHVVSSGGALYYSISSGKYYWFSNNDGTLYQYELFDDGSGRVATQLVRTVDFGSGKTEGVVADDFLGVVYASEETTGVWKIPAEPDAGSTPTLVDGIISEGGHLQPDIEGLTIFYTGESTGYLIVSSQGNDSYVVYKREGANEFIGSFQIVDGNGIDGTSKTDGIDVSNVPLGPTFPYGVFVAQDGINVDGSEKQNQNFKLVRWDTIATALGLEINTSWNPRDVGSRATGVRIQLPVITSHR